MNDMFLVMGWITAICAGWVLILLAVIGLVRMSNFASHQVLDCYGGWKTFLEYREWYWKKLENERNAADQAVKD